MKIKWRKTKTKIIYKNHSHTQFLLIISNNDSLFTDVCIGVFGNEWEWCECVRFECVRIECVLLDGVGAVFVVVYIII